MQKFVIRNRKKRKYTKKTKVIPSFSLINAAYGIIPLLVILVAFMATFFISSTFRNSLDHIKFTFQFPVLPTISFTSITDSAGNDLLVLMQDSRLVWISTTGFLSEDRNIISNSLFALMKLAQQLNPNFIIKPSVSFIHSVVVIGQNVVAQLFIFFTICYNEILTTSIVLINIVTHSNPLPFIKPLIRLNQLTILINLQFLSGFTNILIKSAFISDEYLFQFARTTVGIGSDIILMTYAVSNTIVSVFPLIVSSISATIIPPVVTTFTTVYTFLLNSSLLLYNTIIYYINTALQIISFSVIMSLSFISSFFMAVGHTIDVAAKGIAHIIAMPFTTLNDGIMQLKPYMVIFDDHIKMAGIDFANCFNSFEKISALIKGKT